MRIVKYFFRSFLLVIIIGLLWGKSSHAQTPTAFWTDSLRVSIVDSTVISGSSGTNYLEFKIVVERINRDWNTPTQPDTVLGNSDLYFYADFSNFSGLPKFTHVHDSLSVGFVTMGNPNAILQANIEIWAERLHIALTRQDQGSALLKVPVNPSAKYKLKLAVGKPDTLCTVQWKLATNVGVRLGIRWDKGSTGLQTYGGNPIIDSLTGDIKKIPADSLEVDCMPKEIYACEGGSVAIGMHAESTGRGPIFEWYDSIPGGGQAYPVLASATTQNRITPGGKKYTYDYRFNTVGDTLYIDKVPNSIDSIYFYCVVSDTTLTKSPRKYCKSRLFVRDSIKGFVSPLNSIYTLNKIDTVTICSGDSVVSVRFNFFGVTADELSDIDSVYMIYRNDPCNGDVLTEDTVGINMGAVNSDATIDGMDVWYWEVPIKVKRGKVYIQKIGTYYCDNTAVAVEYDTIFVKEDELQMLPRVTVAPTKSVKIDSVPSTIFQSGISYSESMLTLTSLRGLGTTKKSNGNRLPFYYTANDTTGLDTVLYTFKEPKRCAYMREVEIQDLKYLTLKVYLWGAWRSGSGSMYAFMGSVTNLGRLGQMNPTGAFYESPYNSNYKIPTNRLQAIVQDRVNKGIDGFVDWVEVELVDAQTTASSVKPFKIIQKVASISALVRQDGVVCDTAGNPYISFKNVAGNNYYIIVRHRNHLGIMSGIKVSLLTTRPLLTTPICADFTSTEYPLPIAGNPNVAYYRSANINYMYVGNLDGNDRITIADLNRMLQGLSSVNNYYIEDIDFNFKGTVADVNLWKGVVNGIPIEAFN